MRPKPDDLPRALQLIADKTGLEYMRGLNPPFPIACSATPVLQPEEIERLPIQLNFHATVLDLDRDEDCREYERIMDYYAAKYGMQIVHIERVLVNKIKTVQGKKVRCKVRRVFLEYYAPYRVFPQQ